MQTHGKNTADFVFQVPRSNISAVEPRILKVLPLFRAEALHYWPQPDTPLMGGMLHFGTHCSLRGRPVSLLSSMSSTMDLFCLLVECRDLGLGWSRWFVLISDNNFSPSCHDAGAACLAHATQHQLLLSAGKKGLVRNRQCLLGIQRPFGSNPSHTHFPL